MAASSGKLPNPDRAVVQRHKLTKGHIGTVVEYLDRGEETALLVEFAGSLGRTFAMVELKPDQLIVLHRKIEAA